MMAPFDQSNQCDAFRSLTGLALTTGSITAAIDDALLSQHYRALEYERNARAAYTNLPTRKKTLREELQEETNEWLKGAV